ncbi:hypothetical protein D9M70_567760 [compost metagenome]
MAPATAVDLAAPRLPDSIAPGFTDQVPLARQPAPDPALGPAPKRGPPNLEAATASMAMANSAGGAMTVTFSPTIHVQGGAGADVRSQVNQALEQSYAEFQRHMRQWQHQQKRLSFGETN